MGYFRWNFNPRLREGGDEIAKELGYKALDFNPRLREGGDKTDLVLMRLAGISIHASAKEATCKNRNNKRAVFISIHASAKEATVWVQYTCKVCAISIHASAKEATLLPLMMGKLL